MVGGFNHLEKYDESSVGMMTFHSQVFLESHNPVMFQNTNQKLIING